MFPVPLCAFLPFALPRPHSLPGLEYRLTRTFRRIPAAQICHFFLPKKPAEDRVLIRARLSLLAPGDSFLGQLSLMTPHGIVPAGHVERIPCTLFPSSPASRCIPCTPSSGPYHPFYPADDIATSWLLDVHVAYCFPSNLHRINSVDTLLSSSLSPRVFCSPTHGVPKH